MKVVIIGGVAGGATAAARLRRLDEHAEIIIFERSGFISYANCGLPYYIGGIIEDEVELTLQTPKSFRRRFNIDARVNHNVTKIDPSKKSVTVENLKTGEVFEESYDKLILAPGAKPVIPDLPGIQNERIFTLRTVEDTLKIRRYIEHKNPKSAVIVGGGFIGLEMAENLSERGISVTIAEYSDHLLANLDSDMASAVHARLRKHGIKLMLGAAVSGFSKKGNNISSEIGKSSVISDMVILSVGVAPDSALAKEAGLALGIKDSISVNDKMETSAPDIYAVGDAVEVTHFVSGSKALISLAGPANKEARIVADNICGRDSRYGGSQGSSVLKIFDMTVASTGLSEAAANAAGISCEVVILSPASHASYYPGGRVMTIKVVFEHGTNKLLGAQIIGSDGVDKRIDVIATAIRAGFSAPELKELELSYAPPFSSAKDPVNMAGFIAENVADGTVKQFRYADLCSLPRDGSVFLLDTRTAGEFAKGHTKGFINIPVDSLRERLSELPSDKPIYVMCQTGLRSYIACRILSGNGFDCYNFVGGYRFYEMVFAEKEFSLSSFPCGADKS